VAKKNLVIKNLAEKTVEELNQLLKKSKEEWVKLKMELAVSKLKNLHACKSKRKEIAKIKTVIREKELKK
jgi:large subunit ribosomal protein L29